MRNILFIVLFFTFNLTNAEVIPNSLFKNHMVLQRNVPIAIFGKATTEKEVTVTFMDNSYSTKVENGRWKLFLDEAEAGGPFKLVIKGENKIILSDILIGEVWICSGQSNMEMPLRGNKGQPINGSNLAILESGNSQIRFFKVEKKLSDIPLDECGGEWKLCTPESSAAFSATAYFFGKRLQESLKVPIGLVCSSWGATPAESWTPKGTIEKKFKGFNNWFNVANQPQKSPTVLYNAMINPLVPFTIKGTIWYQGEANKTRPKQYAVLFPAMIESWREVWKQGDFPFYFAQIAPLSWGGENQALLRESQLKSMLSVKNAGMAVTLDIGEPDCIHPAEKQKVGERLALWALAKDYGVKNIEYSGPVFKSMSVKEGKVSVQFEFAPLGVANYGKPMNSFVVAGEDKLFYSAKAKIVKGQLFVWSEKVKKPIAVRYGWEPYVDGSLFNTAGLPASSFRTDDW